MWKRRSVVVGVVVGLVLLVVGIAWASIDPYSGDIPHGVDIGEALPIVCEEPTYGSDPNDALECDELVDEDGNVDMQWGASTNTGLFWQWKGDPDSGFWLQLAVDRGTSAYYGPTSGNALLCAPVGTGWQTRYIAERSVAGGFTAFEAYGGARLYEASGQLSTYIFIIPDYTYSDPDTDCAAADPGAPAVGPSIAPTILVEPFPPIEEQQEFDVTLIAEDHDGEDVTCTMQTQTTAEGTVASGEFLAFDGLQLDSGIYGVQCCADDGAFDDTEPEIECIQRNVTIGAGLDEIIDSGCGAWYNIGCHFGAAIKWAFVPDGDVLYEMWDELVTETEVSWPLGPLVSAVAVVGDALVDFGRGADDAMYYSPSNLKCNNDSDSEACEMGLCISCSYSEYDEGGGSLWTVIPLAGGSEGDGMDFPETRILGAPEEDTALATWAIIISNMFRVLLVVAAARAVIGLASSIMGRHPPGEQMSFKFYD